VFNASKESGFTPQKSKRNQMKYRAEIDGLRAVAVVPVILFHAGFKRFSGGFVGVDVFFVISGYLITTIILTEQEVGKFSLVQFYERRARRILPALFTVMAASLPFAWLWLMPSDMLDFSQSLVAVSTFASNILFWRETGYWGTANELKPLLHTWSLAVEEQYYILFPLFLMFMRRFRKFWVLSSFFAIATASLLASQWGALNSPTANFFLLPSRAWELAMGGCIAFYFLYAKPAIRSVLSHKPSCELLSLIGLVMICTAISFFDRTVPYPSVYTLVPTIGAGLIIMFSSSQTVIGRLLGKKLVVGIGLISYSSYLLHQPLFAFARHRSQVEPSALLFALLATVSFFLAYLIWRFVEKPFRHSAGISRKSIFVLALTGTGTFGAIGLAGHVTGGFEHRTIATGSTLRSLEEKVKVNNGLSTACEGAFTLSADCRTSENPEVLVWGDSYAMHLVPGILASNPEAKVIQMTKSDCGPLFGVAAVAGPGYAASSASGCLEFTERVQEWLHAHKTIKFAVLSSPFSQYLSENNALIFQDGKLAESTVESVTREFRKTLEELKKMGITPIVFSPPPANGADLGRCLVRTLVSNRDLDDCNFRVSAILDEQLNVNRFLRNIEENYRVVYLSDFICDSVLCKTHLGSIFIYRDAGHLSHEGAVALGKAYNFYRIIVEGGDALEMKRTQP
jgi:peptidoglycan/LPS O-acetylase OafA/YrhL